MVDLLNCRVRDRCGGSLFVEPALVHDLAHPVDLVSYKRLLHGIGVLLEVVHRLKRLLRLGVDIVDLGLDNLRREAASAGVVEEDIELQLTHRPRPYAERVHDNPLVVPELHEVEAAEGRGVLILEPAAEPHVLTLDAPGELRNVVLGERKPQPLGKGLEDCHNKG